MSSYAAIDDAWWKWGPPDSFCCKEIFLFLQSVSNHCVDTLALGRYPISSVLFGLMVLAYIDDVCFWSSDLKKKKIFHLNL